MGILSNLNKIPLAFGGAAISGEGGGYGFGDISEDSAIGLLNEAKDLGIKIFDTAPIYGFGLSEVRMGKAFKKCREDVFIVSKSGITWNDNKRVNLTNHPKITQRMLEQSLKDLQSDYIDLYMVHWPDPNHDIRFPLDVLSKAQQEGKIKHIGLCNTNKEDYEKSKEVCKIEVLQSELHPFNLSAKDEIFQFCSDDDLSFMSWGTLDKGILTGSINKKREQSKKYDEKDCRKSAPWWNQAEVLKKVDVVEKVMPILEKAGHSGLEWAIGHNLSFNLDTTVLVGMKNSNHLESTIKAFENLPSKDLLEEIQSIVNAN